MMLAHLVRHPCKNGPQGGLKMKTRTLVSIVILVLTVLVVVSSCATGKKMIAANDVMKKFEGI